MQIDSYTPILPLRPFINQFQLISSTAAQINHVLPHLGFAMAVQLSGQVHLFSNNQLIRLPSMSISGVRKSFRLFSYEPNTTTLIARFTKTGIAGLLAGRSRELYDLTAPLADYFPSSELTKLEDALNNATKKIQWFKIFEAFLLEKFRLHEIDPLIQQSIKILEREKGLISIRNLRNSLFISKDAFEKRFRSSTGITPKQFARTLQMHTTIKQLNQSTDLLSLAINNGFYDAAHLSKAFKDFTGYTPNSFNEKSNFW